MHQPSSGYLVSSPSRGTWIENCTRWPSISTASVVPLAGDVDRKRREQKEINSPEGVVPLAGDVDRKIHDLLDDVKITLSSPSRGTWIEKSVCVQMSYIGQSSSPSRGTWIEKFLLRVRLRRCLMSSPSRGTWIEKPHIVFSGSLLYVVPLAGDVDRKG